MKKLVLFGALALIMSCNTPEELQEIEKENSKLRLEQSLKTSDDTWIKQNLSIINNLQREEIINFRGSLQREVFRTMSPNARKRVWLDKMNHLKTIVVREDELQFVKKIENIITNLSFDKGWQDNQRQEIEDRFLKASLDFNWSKTFIVYAFGTLHSLDKKITVENDFFSAFETSEKGIIEGIMYADTNNRAAGCNCNWGWCGDGGDCTGAICSESDFGCGFIFMGSCDELCSPIDQQ